MTILDKLDALYLKHRTPEEAVLLCQAGDAIEMLALALHKRTSELKKSRDAAHFLMGQFNDLSIKLIEVGDELGLQGLCKPSELKEEARRLREDRDRLLQGLEELAHCRIDVDPEGDLASLLDDLSRGRVLS